MVSVVFNIDKNNLFTHWCLDSILSNKEFIEEKANELYLYDNASGFNFEKEYSKEFKFSGSIFLKSLSDKKTPLAIVLNECLDRLNNNYIVIIPFPVLLPKNWYEDLIENINTVMKTGIASISSTNKGCRLSPHLTIDDELRYVWQRSDNTVNGPIAFTKKILETIGGFDPLVGDELCIKHFSDRISRLGYINYYLFQSSCFDLIENKETEFPANEIYYKDSIEQMIIEKDFSIQYKETSEILSKAYLELEQLREIIHTSWSIGFVLPITKHFGLRVNGLSAEHLIEIENYCTKFNLWYMVSGPMNDNYFPLGITITFYENKK